MAEKKNKGGRPSKIKPFIKVANEVLFSENVILFTDEELVDEINERLEEKYRICQSTFQKWKAGKIESDDLGSQFLRLIKKALREQKKNLLEKYSTDDKAWTRWAWIIERKFSEWNLKHISENKNTNTNDITISFD